MQIYLPGLWFTEVYFFGNAQGKKIWQSMYYGFIGSKYWSIFKIFEVCKILEYIWLTFIFVYLLQSHTHNYSIPPVSYHMTYNQMCFKFQFCFRCSYDVSMRFLLFITDCSDNSRQMYYGRLSLISLYAKQILWL